MRLSKRERITAAASFAGCCVLVLSAVLPLLLKGGGPVPAAAPPPAVSSPPSASSGRPGASLMPVTARQVPSSSASYATPVLAAYGQSTGPAAGGSSPAHSTVPPRVVAAPEPSPAPSPRPQATGSPAPTATASSPAACTVSVNALGASGCIRLGG